MEIISVFDMLKIGIGPSSSHTLGPWKAANKFIENVKIPFEKIVINLYGSLSLTGKGHATDIAVVLGLMGEIPEEIDPFKIQPLLNELKTSGILRFKNSKEIKFSLENDIVFEKTFLPYHPNGVTFTAIGLGISESKTFFSIGGGFVISEDESERNRKKTLTIPFPIQNGLELLSYCDSKKNIGRRF